MIARINTKYVGYYGFCSTFFGVAVGVTDTLLQAHMITISWSRANKEQLVPANVLVSAYFPNSCLSLRFSVRTFCLRFLAFLARLSRRFSRLDAAIFDHNKAHRR